MLSNINVSVPSSHKDLFIEITLWKDLINLTFSSIIYHIRFDLQAQITRACYSKEKIYLCLIMDILYLEADVFDYLCIVLLLAYSYYSREKPVHCSYLTYWYIHSYIDPSCSYLIFSFDRSWMRFWISPCYSDLWWANLWTAWSIEWRNFSYLHIPVSAFCVVVLRHQFFYHSRFHFKHIERLARFLSIMFFFIISIHYNVFAHQNVFQNKLTKSIFSKIFF